MLKTTCTGNSWKSKIWEVQLLETVLKSLVWWLRAREEEDVSSSEAEHGHGFILKAK